MSIDVTHRAWLDVRLAQRPRHDIRLALNTRRGEAHFVGAVVVDGGAEDYRMNLIAIGKGG